MRIQIKTITIEKIIYLRETQEIPHATLEASTINETFNVKHSYRALHQQSQCERRLSQAHDGIKLQALNSFVCVIS